MERNNKSYLLIFSIFLCVSILHFVFVPEKNIPFGARYLSKVKNESTLFPGEDTKIQTIVIWQTDEPTYCQVFYMQGLVRDANNKGEALPKEQNPLADHTQVIVGFASATVYPKIRSLVCSLVP